MNNYDTIKKLTHTLQQHDSKQVLDYVHLFKKQYCTLMKSLIVVHIYIKRQKDNLTYSIESKVNAFSTTIIIIIIDNEWSIWKLMRKEKKTVRTVLIAL